MPISMFPMLLEAVAADKARPAQLLDQCKPNDTLRYNTFWARYMKRKPGDFLVELGEGENTTESINAVTPVEAKLLVIEYLVACARENLEQEPPPSTEEMNQAQVYRGTGPRRR